VNIFKEKSKEKVQA